MKKAISNTTITGSNHINIFNSNTAAKIATIINIKSWNSMELFIFDIVYKLISELYETKTESSIIFILIFYCSP